MTADWGSAANRDIATMEARYSLPGIFDGSPSLDDIFLATLHQRARLKQDQQLVEWQASLG